MLPCITPHFPRHVKTFPTDGCILFQQLVFHSFQERVPLIVQISLPQMQQVFCALTRPSHAAPLEPGLDENLQAASAIPEPMCDLALFFVFNNVFFQNNILFTNTSGIAPIVLSFLGSSNSVNRLTHLNILTQHPTI